MTNNTLNAIIYFLSRTQEKYGRDSINKTKLLKLLYLLDYFGYRKNRRKVTDIKWKYFLYGPWSEEYDNILNARELVIENDSYNEKDFKKISLKGNLHIKEYELDIETKPLAEKVLTKYGKAELRDILDYIYFETEPMINADKRGEFLDFETINEEAYYEIKNLGLVSEKDKKRLKRKAQELLANVNPI